MTIFRSKRGEKVINETDLIIRMSDYIMAYDMNKKLIPAIVKAAEILNSTRKDNDEPDLREIKNTLENEYGWRFEYVSQIRR